MNERQRQRLIVGFILVWSGALLAACRDTAAITTPISETASPTTMPAILLDIPPATLTEEALQQFIATSLAEHPRTTPTPEPPELAANMAAANANSQTRIAGQATAMKQRALAAQQTSTPDISAVSISAASIPVKVDGRITNGEWDSAASRPISLGNGSVTIQIQHDETALFVVFSGLNQGGQQRFPELFLDRGNDKSDQLDDNDWWFQAAATPCWGSGPDAIWQQCGAPQNWRVSTWTTNADVVEMAIPYATIGLVPGDTQPVGLAFALLSVTADGREIRSFWPNTAELNAPQTWGTALAPEGW